MKSCRLPLAVLLALAPLAGGQAPDAPDTLPGTRPLEWDEVEQADMADRLMDGAHRFIDRKIDESIAKRPRHWNRDLSGGAEAYEASVEPNRERFRRLIGVVDERAPVVMERFGDDHNPALVAETDAYRVHQARWKVFEGVWGEGLLVEPRGEPAGAVIVLPDADQSPEQAMGLAEGIDAEAQAARRLAERGFRRGMVLRELMLKAQAARRLAERGFIVVIPTLVDRRPLDPAAMDIPAEAVDRLERTEQTHREWLYRQSYHMGRHVIGYEVQKVLAAVDWLERRGGGGEGMRIGVAGYGEGGLIAFHAAAADTRIDAALVSGYFDSRQAGWAEPIYRNIWALLDEFGDAELATLIAPRGLIVEHSPVAEITGHKGEIVTAEFESVLAEFNRIGELVPRDFQPRTLVHAQDGGPTGPGSAEALGAFTAALGVAGADFESDTADDAPLEDRRAAFDPADRHHRQVQQIEGHVQRLVRNSHRVRQDFYAHAVMPEIADTRWSTETTHPTHPHEPFVEASAWYRDYFHEQVNGRFEDEPLPPDPRTRKVYDEERWAGYDVVLDVFDDLFAWGVLLVPHDIEPGERRPVVVVQHGRNGLPENLIVRDHSSYRRVAARLADRGFVVFVPHNLYRTEERYRWLNRKANTVKATLYSFIVHQHDQILRWLHTLEFVDGERIGFYGNSFGGETALRVPPLLEGYALSISASYFNQWARKVAGTNDHFGYMFTDEWEVPVFNAGHTFDHAELAYLMVPRPFMVERGHHDHVAHDRWVAHEYAYVRRLYAMLGLADRTEITFFQGGHGMRQEATFDFLHKHLDWPRPGADPER